MPGGGGGGRLSSRCTGPSKAWFHRWTTETDVTNLRVVHKTGFIKRRTFEMSLDKVESVDVNQSILGRLLNYGDVTVRGVGEGAETIETIASPLTSATTSPRDRDGDAAMAMQQNSPQFRPAPPASTVDPAEIAKFSKLSERVVGSQRQDGAAAQDQSAAADLYPRRRLPQVRAQRQKPELPVRPAHPRYRLRRRPVVRAVHAARRAGDRRRSVRHQYRGRQAACRQGPSVDRLSLHHGRGDGRARALRHRAGDGSGRACHRCRRCSSTAARRCSSPAG